MTLVAEPPRPRRLGLLLGLLGGALALVVLLAVGTVLVLQALDRQAALEEHATAADRLADAVETATSTAADADDVLALAADPLVPAEAAAALLDERDVAATAIDDADALRGTVTDPLPTADVRALTADLLDSADLVAATERGTRGALDDLLLATRDAAPAFDEAHFEAENQPRIAFRVAADGLADALDGGSGAALATFLEAGRLLAASHDEELAEKAGPLFDLRMAVQAYARSIDGGVMLEFDWAPTVNGYGSGNSYGGTSYWVSDHGGYATITLSDSVARMWPGAGVMALVTHEVGHAILSRPDCYDLYFGSEFDLGNEESWATAWAIGMGQTADGSGESIYGRPPSGLVALSQQCR